MRRLNDMISFRLPPVVPDMDVALFRRLQAFEARAAGAPPETLGAITAARSSLGLGRPRDWIPMPRGH